MVVVSFSVEFVLAVFIIVLKKEGKRIRGEHFSFFTHFSLLLIYSS